MKKKAILGRPAKLEEQDKRKSFTVSISTRMQKAIVKKYGSLGAALDHLYSTIKP